MTFIEKFIECCDLKISIQDNTISIHPNDLAIQLSTEEYEKTLNRVCSYVNSNDISADFMKDFFIQIQYLLDLKFTEVYFTEQSKMLTEYFVCGNTSTFHFPEAITHFLIAHYNMLGYKGHSWLKAALINPDFWNKIPDSTQDIFYQHLNAIFTAINSAQTVKHNDYHKTILDALYSNSSSEEEVSHKLMNAYLYFKIMVEEPDIFETSITQSLGNNDRGSYYFTYFNWQLFYAMFGSYRFVVDKKPKHAEKIAIFVQPIIQLILDAIEDIYLYDYCGNLCYFPPAKAIEKFLSQCHLSNLNHFF